MVLKHTQPHASNLVSLSLSLISNAFGDSVCTCRVVLDLSKLLLKASCA